MMDRNSAIYHLFRLIIAISGFLLNFHSPAAAQVYAEPGFMEMEDTSLLPGFVEGPHVQWSKDRKAQAVFFKYDSATRNVRAELVSYKIKEEGKYIRGYNFGPKDYYIQKTHPYLPSEYRTDAPVLVVGDVHGEYDRLLSMLQNSGVVNNRGDWTWGNGFVVFLGDIVDRGDQVTEALWFIKKIQHQASEAGGMVQLILGNHEIMDLTGDHRYVNKKYRTICEELDIDYFEFFSSEMELGRWLRSMNTLLKVNDNLFVHGGISPELLDMKLPRDSINHLVHQFLRGEINARNFDILFFLTDNKGPYWYRGFLKSTPEYPKMTGDELKELLGFYGVSRIIYGHTEDKYFRINPEGSLFAIDVPLRYSGKSEQALLLKGDKIFRVYSDGSLVEIQLPASGFN